MVRQANRLHQLEAENQSLRAENRQLLRKIREAEKTIARLQKLEVKAA